MRVLKFGGSCLNSIAGAEAVLAAICRASKRGEIIVVTSALFGVTNQLIQLVEAAEHRRTAQWKKILKVLRAQHEVFVSTIVPRLQRLAIRNQLASAFDELAQLCAGIGQLRECTPRTHDRVVGHGELLASWLLAAALRGRRVKAEAVDARQLIVTDENFGNAKVERAPTRKKLRDANKSWRGKIPVITGFIAATPTGIPTTVGRNGSDFTAALIGALLKAREIEIWTDVDGVMSADPHQVDEAFVLPKLSYAEAMELAYFGAKVLHPKSVIPAIDAKVPLIIRNVFNPSHKGTRITAKPDHDAHPVKGITSIPNVALLSLEGAGMVGVTGVASRMFAALSASGMNVVLISQASSEQSICCVVQSADAEASRLILQRTFAGEMKRHEIRRVQIFPNVAIVAVVGTAMRGTPGIAGRLFTALGKNKINVMAVAQGSAEQNISIVLQESERAKALNVIHGAFHLARQHVNLVVVGKGRIGSTLLKQLAASQERLERELDLRLRLVGIADSTRWCFDPEGMPVDRWRQRLARSKDRVHLEKMGVVLHDSGLENLIIVDATASEHVAKHFAGWLERGISVVTPNKKANTLTQSYYDRLMELIRRRNSYYLYETCVGAGLPVISTLQDLLDSGDQLIKVEAMLSGTLGYLFSELEKGVPFSQVVRQAHKLGYTEPDPREDLSGMDVARKLLILARKAGRRLALSQVTVEPLLPPALRAGGSVDGFLKKLSKVDAAYAKKVAAAAKEGKVLRYLGRIRGNTCAVQLDAVPKNSPFGLLEGGDNLVIFTTDRYRTNPIHVRGPGAGPDVTAGGVFADVLKVAHLLTST